MVVLQLQAMLKINEQDCLMTIFDVYMVFSINEVL